MAQIIEVPGYGEVEFPDEMSDAQIVSAVQQITAKPSARDEWKQTISAAPSPVEGMSTLEKVAAGAGMGAMKIARPVGQALGIVSQADIDEANRLGQPLEQTGAGSAGSFIGSAAALLPTMLIPGAATLPGAAAIGAGTGLLTTDGGLQDRAVGGLLGGIAGPAGVQAGRALGNIASAATQRVSDQVAKNAVRDATLKAAQEAGYVVSPTSINPSQINLALESIAGKAATKQDATIRNQEVTNMLARRALGIPENEAISAAAIRGAKDPQMAVYAEVANMSDDAKQALEFWRQANFDKIDYQKSYTRNPDPNTRKLAKAAEDEANNWQTVLEEEAVKAGKPELVSKLAAARKELGKIGTVENALNESTGNVSARELAKAMDRGVPLSGDLRTAAAFADAFPQWAAEGSMVPAPGVSKLGATLAAVLGGAGATTMGPAGALLAATPLLSGVARRGILAPSYQSAMASPVYRQPMTAGLLSLAAPRAAIPIAGSVYATQ